MRRKRHTAAQMIGLLRQAKVELAQGQTTREICREFRGSEASFCPCRSEYGGPGMHQPHRLKDLGSKP